MFIMKTAVLPPIRACFISVSYTHLDVYKRQCEAEMDNEYNARIITYYDPQYHCSEYFVESYINYLYDPETFQQLQPRTYEFIYEANNQINS